MDPAYPDLHLVPHFDFHEGSVTDEEPLVRKEAVSCCTNAVGELINSKLFCQWRRYAHALEQQQELEQHLQYQHADDEEQQADLHGDQGCARLEQRCLHEQRHQINNAHLCEASGEGRELETALALQQRNRRSVQAQDEENAKQVFFGQGRHHPKASQPFLTPSEAAPVGKTTAAAAYEEVPALASAVVAGNPCRTHPDTVEKVSSSVTRRPPRGSERTGRSVPLAKRTLLLMQRLEQLLLLATCTDTPARGCEASLLLQLLLEVVVQVFPVGQAYPLLWELVIASAGEKKERTIRSACLHKYHVLLPPRGSRDGAPVGGTAAATTAAAPSFQAVTCTVDGSPGATGTDVSNTGTVRAPATGYTQKTACGDTATSQLDRRLCSSGEAAGWRPAPGPTVAREGTAGEAAGEHVDEPIASRATMAEAECGGTASGLAERPTVHTMAPQVKDNGETRVVGEVRAGEAPATVAAKETMKRAGVSKRETGIELTAPTPTSAAGAGGRPLFDEELANLHAEEVLLGQTAARLLLRGLSDVTVSLWSRTAFGTNAAGSPSAAGAAAVSHSAAAESAKRDGGLAQLVVTAASQTAAHSQDQTSHTQQLPPPQYHDSCTWHRKHQPGKREHEQGQIEVSQGLLFERHYVEKLRFLWSLRTAMRTVAEELEDARLCLEVVTPQRIIWGQCTGTLSTESGATPRRLQPQLQVQQTRVETDEKEFSKGKERSRQETPFSHNATADVGHSFWKGYPSDTQKSAGRKGAAPTSEAAPGDLPGSIHCTQQWLFQPFVVLLLKAGLLLLLVPAVGLALVTGMQHHTTHCNCNREAASECGSPCKHNARVSYGSSSSSASDHFDTASSKQSVYMHEVSRSRQWCGSVHVCNRARLDCSLVDLRNAHRDKNFGSPTLGEAVRDTASCRCVQSRWRTGLPHKAARRHKRCAGAAACCARLSELRNTVLDVCRNILELHAAFQRDVAQTCMPHWLVLHISGLLVNYSCLLLRAFSTQEEHEEDKQGAQPRRDPEGRQHEGPLGQEHKHEVQQNQRSRQHLPGGPYKGDAMFVAANCSSAGAKGTASHHTAHGSDASTEKSLAFLSEDALTEEASQLGSSLACALLYALPRGETSFGGAGTTLELLNLDSASVWMRLV